MKKFLFPALALGLVLTSCQSDEPFAPGMGEEVQATFTISVPDAMGTRAASHSSAEGGFTNGAGQLNYTVVLLNDAKKVMYSATSAGNGTSATFSPTVVQGYNYKILAYATFDSAVEAPTVGQTIADTDAINNIATLKGINDESEDAYFCNTTVLGQANMSAMLKRPFGKLRLVATDYNKLQDLGVEVESVKVTYGENVKMEQTFDTFNKAFEVEGGNKVCTANKTTYTEAADNELTVFVDYLPAADGENDETMYPFEIEVTYANGKGTYTRTFSQDIPVKRNYLTTLRGDFFTTEAALTLTVDEMFENAINVNKWDGTTVTPVVEKNGTYAVSTAAELAWIAGVVNGTITRAEGDDFAGKTIVMMGDIDLNNHQWTPIGTEENPFKGTFEAYGNTIKNLNIVEEEAKEGKAFIGFFGYAKNATIKNVTFENVNLNIACLDIDHSQGHIGAVAGSLEGTSTIENVTVKGDIKVESTVTANGASRVAVVAGGNSYGNVTMKNVHVVANEGSYLKANNNVGALAGQLQGKSVFVNCTSNIDVTGTKFFAGGLIGLAAGDQLFKNCHTTGNVAITAGREGRNHDQYRVGGIAGGWADGATKVCELVNCSYTGEVSGKNSDGSVANPLDYWGYVGRGYTLNGCQGSTVIIDGVKFVQKYNTAAQAGIYDVINEAGHLVVATVDELKEKLADANVQNIYLADGVTFEGTFSITSNKNIISNPLNKATLKGRVEVRSCNPTFENVEFDRNETDSNNAMQIASNALQYKAVVMIYGNQTNKVTFKKCDFYNNNGTHKSAITNTAVELIVDECYFEGRSSSIYSQCNLSVTNSTFNYTGGNNVIASINGCGETGGKFIFKNNKIAGEKIFALSQFLSTVGFSNGKYFFDVQNNTGAGFDYYFLNEGRVPNAEFAIGSEKF